MRYRSGLINASRIAVFGFTNWDKYRVDIHWMSIRMIFKRSQKFNVSLALAWLFAAVLLTLPFSARSAPSQDTVYCPLQKKWVKQNTSSSPKPSSDILGDICVSEKTRSRFNEDLDGFLRKSLRTFSQKDVIKVFFEYLGSGENAFSYFNGLPSTPQHRGNAFLPKDPASVTTQRNPIETALPATSIIATFIELLSEKTSVSFAFIDAAAASSVPRSIRPRAPPFSL